MPPVARRAVACVIAAGALAAGGIVAAPVGASGSVGSARSCQPFRLDGVRYHVTIEKGRVTCHTARMVLRAFLSGQGKLHGPTHGPAYKQYWTLYGWRCGHGAGGGGCIRRGKSYTTARDYILAESEKTGRVALRCAWCVRRVGYARAKPGLTGGIHNRICCPPRRETLNAREGARKTRAIGCLRSQSTAKATGHPSRTHGHGAAGAITPL
jgi:hypothetical protein